MKKLLLTTLFTATCLFAAAQGVDHQAPAREHRAVWMSPMLSNTWPSGNITEANAATRRSSLLKTFERLREQGINTIYYHARANCDATYASSYEPYASGVAGGRGNTPAFDPFGYVVEAAHECGLEIYAWVNPYRYSSGGTYGAGERNYENSHPDWLIRQSSQIVLNPGIPEVQDRIEAIITEIATNYDIDGMIFDDYFYTSGTPLALDKEQYEKYGKGYADQAAWRRANVNETVRRAHDAVKAVRPYAAFAIGPAGRVNPPDIGTYGLPAAPYECMNYNALHADPIKWLSMGWLDFLSPQIYWSDRFDKLTDWYCIAVPHFGRHLYTSVDASRAASYKAAEYQREITYTRDGLRPNESGVVFFDFGSFNNYYEKVDGTTTKLGDILAQTVFPTATLQPIQPWRGDYAPAYVTNLRREGATLKWDEPADAVHRRYTVYAVPAAEANAGFACDKSCLAVVSYKNSYEIPADAGDVRYAVAVYDRYGNEYAPVLEGIAASTVKAPELVAPADGEEATDLFDFKWTAAPGRYVIEIASDADFTAIVNRVECNTTSIPGGYIADFVAGQSYWWRVRLQQACGTEAVSAAQSFTPSRIAFTAPAAGETEVSLTPTFTWTPGGDGAEYDMEISTTSNFGTISWSGTTTDAQITVPQYVLRSGTAYFARVTGRRGASKSVAETLPFSTIDRSDYEAPAFVNPAADGAVMHSNFAIEVEPWEGMVSVGVEISATTDFPSRSIASLTLKDFETATKPLSEIKISSKALVDGATYYTRARGTYALTTASSGVRTEYGPVRSFVYSATAGLSDVVADASTVRMEGNVLIVPQGCRVAVFDLAGRCAHMLVNAPGRVSLDALDAGIYIIRVDAQNTFTLKWVK